MEIKTSTPNGIGYRISLLKTFTYSYMNPIIIPRNPPPSLIMRSVRNELLNIIK